MKQALNATRMIRVIHLSQVSNIMSKNIVVPFVESCDGDKSKGFLVTIPNKSFPIVGMDRELGLEYAQRFWQLMGYQVTDIESRPLNEWMELSNRTNEIYKSYTTFETSFKKLPENVLDELVEVSESTEYDINNIGSYELDDELNKVFSKVTFSFNALSNIMFYDSKRKNYIEKGRVSFITDNDELEKIREFYESNSVQYAVVPVTVDDIIAYDL